MNVLMISKSLHYSYTGGIQTHVWKLSKELIERGHRVTIITAQSIFKPKKRFVDDGIEVIPVSYLSGRLGFFHFFALDEFSFNYSVFREIKKLMNEQPDRFDIVHIQGRNGFLYPRFKKENFPPAIVTFHGTMKNENDAALKDKNVSLRQRWELKLVQGYATEIERNLLNKAEGVIAVSEQMAGVMKRQFKHSRDNVEVIYNGLDLKDYWPAPEKRIPFRIISVARLDPRKGLRFLIEAAKQLRKNFPKLTIHIAGEGDNRQSLEQQIQKDGLERVVYLVGNKRGDNLLREYQEASLFVLPSLGESQGIVFMEAMACGLPVIGFDIGGVNEMITHGVEGILVEKENVAELASAIKRVLSDTELARAMGLRGRTRIEDNFQWEHIAEKTEKFYESVLRNTGRADSRPVQTQKEETAFESGVPEYASQIQSQKRK